MVVVGKRKKTLERKSENTHRSWTSHTFTTVHPTCGATRRLDSESCRTTTNCSKASCTGPDGLMVGALLQTDFVTRVTLPLLFLWQALARQPPRQLAQISFELNCVLIKLHRCPVVS